MNNEELNQAVADSFEMFVPDRTRFTPATDWNQAMEYAEKTFGIRSFRVGHADGHWFASAGIDHRFVETTGPRALCQLILAARVAIINNRLTLMEGGSVGTISNELVPLYPFSVTPADPITNFFTHPAGE